jgi:hypothetical protein
MDRHKHPPIPFRPKEGDRAWLLGHAEQNGLSVNSILRAALTDYRAWWESQPDPAGAKMAAISFYGPADMPLDED